MPAPPVPPPVTVNHGELAPTEAVQLALPVTVAVPVCADAEIDAGLGANATIVTVGVVPACVTANVAGVAPAAVIVMFPTRLDAPTFACAAYVSVALPDPPEPPLEIVSHEASLLDVQLVTLLAVTVAVPVCADGVSKAGLGVNATMPSVGVTGAA